MNTAKDAARGKRERLDTWIVVCIIIVVAAVLTWIVPSGAYEYQEIDVNGTIRSVAVAGTYHAIDKSEVTRTGILGVFSALYEGCVSVSGIIFVIFTCAATFGVMVKTGAFHAGIGKIMNRVGNKNMLLIPVLMLLFALGGSLFGMLSEFYGFYPLIVGLMIALGYDAMTGFAVIALGEYVGFMASTLNPYTVAVAQSIAGVPLYSGLSFRIVCFGVFMAISIAFVMLYAKKVKQRPELSATYGDPCVHTFHQSSLDDYTFTWRHGLVILDMAATLAVLMLGLLKWSWGYKELCGLFILMSVVGGLLTGLTPNEYCRQMLDGAKSVLWGAILTGLAGGITVILKNGQIMDTIIYFLSNILASAPRWLSAQLMLIVQTLCNFLIPSGSGQAAVTMPIMAPLADALGLTRQAACLAFQFGDGLSNLLWPTGGIVIICGLGDIRYDRWLKWFGKLFVILFAAQMLLLEIAVLMGI